jgi:hypothetical protein
MYDPPPLWSALPTKVETLEARAWNAVIDAARDLIECGEAYRGCSTHVIDRVLH